MKCLSCRGILEDSFYTEVKDFGASVVIIRDVPCHKCAQCGETIYDFSVGERVEEIISTIKESFAKLTITQAIVQYSDMAA